MLESALMAPGELEVYCTGKISSSIRSQHQAEFALNIWLFDDFRQTVMILHPAFERPELK